MICCCCGFDSNHGVKTKEGFWCELCFYNPNLFSVAKRILPHWTLAVKTQTKINPFGREGSENICSGLYLTKKAKRELAMSESLYRNQKQLF